MRNEIETKQNLPRFSKFRFDEYRFDLFRFVLHFTGTCLKRLFREQPFNLKGGGYGFFLKKYFDFGGG
jgi:hypothetical protein